MSTFFDRPGGQNQFLAAVFASLGSLSLGASLGWSAPAQHYIMVQKEYGFTVSLVEYGWICAFLGLGCSCAAIPTLLLSNCLGRKLTMLLVVPLDLAGWALIIYATDVHMLMLGRFLQGLCGGSYMITVPTYCLEIAQLEVKETLASFFGAFFVVGILYAYIAGGFDSLQALNYACAILPVIFLFTFIWMPESPVYYLRKKKNVKALKTLRWLREGNATFELVGLNTHLNVMKLADPGLWHSLRSRDILKGLFISISLIFFQTFCGSTAVIMYVTHIVRKADMGFAYTPEMITIFVGIVYLVFSFIAIASLNCINRRLVLIFSTFLVVLCDVLLAIYFHVKNRKEDYLDSIKWLPLFSLCGLMAFYAIGLASMTPLIILDIFPEYFAIVANTIVCTMGGLFVFLSSKMFVITLQELSMMDSFFILAGFSVLAWIFIYFQVPDFKGMTPQEIQDILDAKRSQLRNKSKVEIPIPA